MKTLIEIILDGNEEDTITKIIDTMLVRCKFSDWNIADDYGIECEVCGHSFNTFQKADKLNELNLSCESMDIEKRKLSKEQGVPVCDATEDDS